MTDDAVRYVRSGDGQVAYRRDVGPRRRPKVDEAFAAGEHAFLKENQATTCSAAGHNCASFRKEA